MRARRLFRHGPMRGFFLIALLFASIAAPSVGAEQTGQYLAVNPSSTWAPDCQVPTGGISVGLGGACFTAPAGATTYRVTLIDDVLGPGYGALNLCVDSVCHPQPICGGVAEGEVPVGTDEVSVVAYDTASAWTVCGIEALRWTPTHGTITLEFGAS